MFISDVTFFEYILTNNKGHGQYLCLYHPP